MNEPDDRANQSATTENIGPKQPLNDEALDAVGGGAPNPVAQYYLRLLRAGKIWNRGSENGAK